MFGLFLVQSILDTRMCPSLEAVAIVFVKPNHQFLRCGRVESVDHWLLLIYQLPARGGLVFGAKSPGIVN